MENFGVSEGSKDKSTQYRQPSNSSNRSTLENFDIKDNSEDRSDFEALLEDLEIPSDSMKGKVIKVQS